MRPVAILIILLVASTCWAVNPPPQVADVSSGMLLDAGRVSLARLTSLSSWEAEFTYKSARTPEFVKWMQAEAGKVQEGKVAIPPEPQNQIIHIAVCGKKQRVDITTYDDHGKVVARQIAAWDDEKYQHYQEYQDKAGLVEPVTKDFLPFPTIIGALQAAKRHIVYSNVDADMLGYYYAGKDANGLIMFASGVNSDRYWESITLDPNKDFVPVAETMAYETKATAAHANYSGYKLYDKRWVADQLVYEMMIPGGDGLAKTVTTRLKSFSDTPDPKFLEFSFPPGTWVHDVIQKIDYEVPIPEEQAK